MNPEIMCIMCITLLIRMDSKEIIKLLEKMVGINMPRRIVIANSSIILKKEK